MKKEKEEIPLEGIQSFSIGPSQSHETTTQQMSLEENFRIIKSIGEECIQDDELMNLLAHKPKPVCYEGFKPSGRMHISKMCNNQGPE